MSALLAWLETHETVLWWLAGSSLFLFFASLIAIPILVVRMREDYFVSPAPPPDSWRRQHPVVRVVLRVMKNLAGVVLVIVGALLSLPLIPGQGIATVLIGLSLIDFPGKRALELRLVRQRPVLLAINWIRVKAKRSPVQLPPRSV